jgi:hypothetical protein
MGLFGHPTISKSAPRIFDPPVSDSPLLLDMEKLQCFWCPRWVIGLRKRQRQRRTYDPHELILSFSHGSCAEAALIDVVLGPWTESISFTNGYSLASPSHSLPTEHMRQG